MSATSSIPRAPFPMESVRQESLLLIDTEVNWNKKRSGEVPIEFERNNDYCCGFTFEVHNNRGDTSYGIASKVASGSDFISQSKINEVFHALLKAAVPIKGGELKASMEADQTRLIETYHRIFSANARITCFWSARGSKNIFDQKGAALKLSFNYEVIRVSPTILTDVANHYDKVIKETAASQIVPRTIQTVFQSTGEDHRYFFRGNFVIVYDAPSETVIAGPEKTTKHWKSLRPGFTAAFQHPKNNKFYFFSGDSYVRYTGQTPDDGYPKLIKNHWKGIDWPSIDTAVPSQDGKFIYFFLGSEFLRYDVAKKAAGVTKLIKNHWPGVPDDIDGGFDNRNGAWYFLKGDQCTRYDFEQKDIDSGAGFPKSIAATWPKISF